MNGITVTVLTIWDTMIPCLITMPARWYFPLACVLTSYAYEIFEKLECELTLSSIP